MYYKDYEIHFRQSPPYCTYSADNKQYDKIIKIEDGQFSKCIEVEVSHCEEVYSILITAPYYTSEEYFVEKHNDGLFLMLNDRLCIFDPEKLEIIKSVKIHTLGALFCVYPYGEDYILYGELEIYRISSDLNVKWEFTGRDIFVRYQGAEPTFEMKEDRICLYDFEDNYYEISYDGKLITDYPNSH